MKIKSVSVSRKNLDLLKPYTIARETISFVENIFLYVELDNGMMGIGAANPAPEVVGETPDQTYSNLNSKAAELLVGQDIRHFLNLIRESRRIFENLPGTQACIDIALHDAFCKWIGVSVLDF